MKLNLMIKAVFIIITAFSCNSDYNRSKKYPVTSILNTTQLDEIMASFPPAIQDKIKK